MKTRKILSLVLALAMLASVMVFAPAASATSNGYVNGSGKYSTIEDFDDVQDCFGLGNAVTPDKTIVSTGPTETITINLSKETIYWTNGAATTAPTFVSFDDGGKWSAMKFSIGEDSTKGADFSKFLNKASTIQLTTAIDKATKQPQAQVTPSDGVEAVDAAPVWKFGKIEARPKLGKYSIDYLTYAASDGGAGQWTLKPGDGAAALTNLEVGFSKDKKNVVGGYGTFKSDAGINVVSGESKPGEKLTFLVRVAATDKSAGSKAKKFGPSTLTKAPSAKMDYKKNIIKLKANMIIGEANVSQGTGTEPDTFDNGTYAATFPGNTANPTYDDNTKKIKPLSKEKDAELLKAGIPITLAGTDLDIAVRTAATEKKPASEEQWIRVAKMSTINETQAGLTIKGTGIKLPKGVEAAPWADREKTDTKWKSSIKVDGNGVYAVRLKNTAKYNAKTNATTGNTSSGHLILDVVKGSEMVKNKEKDVAIAAYIGKTGTNNDLTASNITDAVYVPASKLVNTVKATDNKIAKTALAGTDIQVVDGGTANDDVKYKTEGLKSVTTIDNELDDDATDGNEIEIAADETVVKADGTITLSFSGATGTDETFYAPTVVYNVSGYKAPDDDDDDDGGDAKVTALTGLKGQTLKVATTTSTETGEIYLDGDNLKGKTAAGKEIEIDVESSNVKTIVDALDAKANNEVSFASGAISEIKIKSETIDIKDITKTVLGSAKLIIAAPKDAVIDLAPDMLEFTVTGATKANPAAGTNGDNQAKSFGTNLGTLTCDTSGNVTLAVPSTTGSPDPVHLNSDSSTSTGVAKVEVTVAGSGSAFASIKVTMLI